MSLFQTDILIQIALFYILPLILGWMLDLLLGDPSCLPHPVVWFGKAIAFFEKRLNKRNGRLIKGGLTAIILIAATIFLFLLVNHYSGYHFIRTNSLGTAAAVCAVLVRSILVFFFLAGTTLIRETKEVFRALDRSLEAGRRQVARIVGRETDNLSAQEIRTAALETLAENLSDGVVAPLFWYAIGGLPAMAAYKMVNTLDSMIAYKTEKYLQFGRVAAIIDDLANWIPARLTAFLMVMVSGKPSLLKFVSKNAKKHASPNSGYPESALAGILNCRFGGPHRYFGEVIDKPYIGENDKTLAMEDLNKAVRINRKTEVVMIMLTMLAGLFRAVLY